MNHVADVIGLSPFLAALGFAAVFSLGVAPLAMVMARRLGVLDIPGGYKAHGRPTPLLGGIGVVLAMLFPILLLANHRGWETLATVGPLYGGLAIITVAGVIDDARGLSPRRKFLWQVSAAALAAIATSGAGVRLELFLGWGVVPISLLTILWIVLVTNAINFLDNMNGLCAGLGAVVAAALALYNLGTGAEGVALAAVALCGACLGFLPFNWPRARIFLGDTGSMAIGYSLATLSVMGVYTTNAEVPLLAVMAPVFMLAIPVADAAVVIILRLRTGRRPWVGDRLHVSHRLVRRGLRPSQAVAVIWGATAICGGIALLLPGLALSEALFATALGIAIVIALLAASGTKGLE